MRGCILIFLACFLCVSLSFAANVDVGQKTIPAYCKTPILFIHGYFTGTFVTWQKLIARFEREGCLREYLYAPQFDNVYGSNPGHGYEINKWVEYLVKRTGSYKVNIITHSMGGTDARYYIKYLGGHKRVKNLITLGSPHHGTITACIEPVTQAAKDLCSGTGKDDWKKNDFLNDLNSGDETFRDILYTSIWSKYDEMVIPQSSAYLDGAWNIELESSVGHLGTCYCEETFYYIKKALF